LLGSNLALDIDEVFIIGSPAMLRRVLKSKVHRAVVTDANVGYEGSITIDRDLMDAADLVEYEAVHVWDLTNGERLETYVIEGKRGSGTVAINGAAAHLVKRGDKVIIASFATFDEEGLGRHMVRKVFVDDANRMTGCERCDPAAARAAGLVISEEGPELC
jgi:aspartate 1-decarboxylase